MVSYRSLKRCVSVRFSTFLYALIRFVVLFIASYLVYPLSSENEMNVLSQLFALVRINTC